MQSSLADIIKSEKDRLFIVDPECFIIFTGEDSLEGKPFIRIGTWPEMPADLIPFIENIIVPDGMTGNPAFEQFNIDVQDLENNRYIGSENILQRFLNYQKLFGLDLTNAVIVNIEKDLPEISREKAISEKNQFIGVFYRDGNFKTVHGGREIFNLKTAQEMVLPFTSLHDMVVENSINTDRYRNPGLVILDNNPLFFNDGSFTSYLFPAPCLEKLASLKISPEKIKTVIHPSGNYLNITRFMKWKHQKTGQLTIASDHTDEITLLKSLFRNSTVRSEPFDGMDFTTPDGTALRQYRDSYNVRIDFKRQGISLAFVKGISGIREILKDDIDAILIEYSVYEETALLFKSSDTPVFLINDTGKTIDHILSESLILARESVPCTFHRTDSLADLIAATGFDETAKEIFVSEDITAIKEYIDHNIAATEDVLRKTRDLNNVCSILRAISEATGDRNLFSSCRTLIQDLRVNLRKAGKTPPAGNTMKVFFYNRGIYSFIADTETHDDMKLIEEIREEAEDRIDPESINSFQREALKTIIRDRKRLRALLAILMRERIESGAAVTDTSSLQRAIDSRKDYYRTVDIPETNKGYNKKSGESRLASLLGGSSGGRKNSPGPVSFDGKEPGESSSHFLLRRKDTKRNTGTDDNASENLPTQHGPLPSGSGTDTSPVGEVTREKSRRFLLPAAAALVILVPVLFFLLHDRSKEAIKGTASAAKKTVIRNDSKNDTRKDGTEKEKITPSKDILTTRQKERYEKLPLKFKSKISNSDIYRYANMVAVRNGYAELNEKAIKTRNPHWIYPENVFLLLDGQRITVSRGDTLWAIAKRKLIEMDILFHQSIQAAEKASPRECKKHLEDARRCSFSEKHTQILEGLKKDHGKR